MIEFRNFSASYGKETILQYINLSCPDGKMTVIIGINGSGKSTLLKSVIGSTDISNGQILLDNHPLHKLSRNEVARSCAYMAQNKNVPDMTVSQFVLHGRFPYLSYPRHYRKEDINIAAKAMERLDVAKFSDKPLTSLSGGQRQRVYLAMAVTQNTRTILLDEPTAHLDISYQYELMHLCKELAAEGRAVVAVLHELQLALEFADILAIMHKGQLIQCGSPSEIVSSRGIEQAFGVTLHTGSENGKAFYYISESMPKTSH